MSKRNYISKNPVITRLCDACITHKDIKRICNKNKYKYFDDLEVVINHYIDRALPYEKIKLIIDNFILLEDYTINPEYINFNLSYAIEHLISNVYSNDIYELLIYLLNIVKKLNSFNDSQLEDIFIQVTILEEKRFDILKLIFLQYEYYIDTFFKNLHHEYTHNTYFQEFLMNKYEELGIERFKIWLVML